MNDDLARRAVACRHWRWAPGMRRLTFDAGHLYPSRVADDGTYPGGLFPIPDLDDPATLGCLLALVREVAQEPGLHVRCLLPYAPDMSGKTPPPWALYSGRGARWSDRYETEAAALVAALEAAP